MLNFIQNGKIHMLRVQKNLLTDAARFIYSILNRKLSNNYKQKCIRFCPCVLHFINEITQI